MKPHIGAVPVASRWVLAALLLLPSGAVAAAAKPAGPPEDPYSKVVLEDTQGRAIQMSRYAGKVRLFDIWASWCGPCRMGIPHLNRLYDRYRDRGLVVIGVSVDERPADVEAFVRVTPIKYPSGMMNPGLAKLLGETDSVPTSLLVDRNGKLRRKFVGYVEPELMEREITKFLADARAPRN
jgi:thiol-disulfide isomerase/thioredoxin